MTSDELSNRETAVERTIRDFVLHQIRLGIYDPHQPRRPKVDVISFDIEMLELEEADGVAHVAGPVVLRGLDGSEVEQFLRLSVAVRLDGEKYVIPDDAQPRAAYIVETGHPSGACKETAALANL
jgi:hypothetical protein